VSTAQLLIDAFADVLAELGEDITLHASGGDETVSALFTLDQLSVGLGGDNPIAQTATLKLPIGDLEHLHLDSGPTQTVTARGKVWDIAGTEPQRVAFIQCGLRTRDGDFSHTNLFDIDGQQARWAE
jgi:hypothetical protein